MSLRRHLWWQRVCSVAFVMGTMLLVTAAGMFFPWVVSLIYAGEGDGTALAASMAISAGIGAPLWWYFRGDYELHPRDALAVATFGWVVISAVSALPFVIHGSIPSFTDAFFEMMSGYTTTGATILPDIEALPHGLLFWRSETHLIGGMGFVTLAVLVLPNGLGGLRLFRAESSPGQVVTRERFTARNRDAMLYLWGIYLGLNALQTVLMMVGGMSWFDSLCHAFGTVSTSGYSTYNARMGHFESAYLQWVVIVFMFLGGVTFALFYAVLRGDWRALRINTELRWYLGIVGFFCASVSAILWADGTYGLLDAVRHGTFQVVSLLTTTGFTTVDYEQWPQSAQMFLWVVCFIGACAGSTTSGIKIVHYVIIWKFLVAVVHKAFVQPLAVVSVRLNGRRLDDTIIHLAMAYFIVNIFLVFGGGIVMSLIDDLDFYSGMSAVIATLMNVGPGFGEVGPTHNFAQLSDLSKWFLSFNMLVGRLEMFTALVLFYPSFWRS
jgi:trk system potassium uptake protein TrkH